MLLRKWNSKVSVQMLGNMLLFFVFVALPVAQGLYFHIAETERKCFIEEIPDETMVIGKCQTLDFSTSLESDQIGLFNLIEYFDLLNQETTNYNSMIHEQMDLHHRAQKSECTQKFEILKIKSFCQKCTAVKEGGHSLHILQESTLFAYTQILRNGFQEHNWYVLNDKWTINSLLIVTLSLVMPPLNY